MAPMVAVSHNENRPMDEGQVVSIFSAEQVCRLTSLSARQLRYWDLTGFFSPTYLGRSRAAYNRVYSYRDVVGLRAIAVMRKAYGVPLQELRRVGGWLAGHRDSWSGRAFWVRGKRVYWEDPDGGHRLGTRQPGQSEMPIEMDAVDRDLRQEIGRLRERRADQIGRVARHRYTAANEPVIAGTRIPTEAVWRLRQAGCDLAAIRREYPRLTERDLAAALDWESRRRAR